MKRVLFIFFCFFNSLFFAQSNSEDVVKTVVIDAGHGGKDPGCIGKYLKEKDVALRIALKLGNYINYHFPETKVIYTRDKDFYVPLDKRAKIANENDADLFISIHANAASAQAYGTETFVLGLHRSESQQKVAERENSTIHFEDDAEEKYADFDLSPDAIIARQIQLSVFLEQSIYFADHIQREFKAIGRHDRGVKQAGFLVLYKTTMPSVLIEAGFLTNPKEEQYLRDTLNQDRIANGLFRSFQNYKFALEGKSNQLVADADLFLRDLALRNGEKLPEIKKIERSEAAPKDHKVVFKVQIETSRTPISITNTRFKGLDVDEYVQDGLYKYTSGSFYDDLEAAKKYREDLVELGYEHAFVVAFDKNKRISLSDAVNLLSSEK